MIKNGMETKAPAGRLRILSQELLVGVRGQGKKEAD